MFQETRDEKSPADEILAVIFDTRSGNKGRIMESERQSNRTTEVFAERRRWTRFYPDPMAECVSVFINDDLSFKGALTDESFAGVGVQFREEIKIESDQVVTVEIRGSRVAAVARHIRRNDQGTRIGFEWRLVEPLRSDGSDWGFKLLLNRPE